MNLYTYVHNKPLIYTDPSGHYCVSADGKWAHEKKCDTEGSYELGDDADFKGHPVVENGMLVRLVGVIGTEVLYKGKNIPFVVNVENLVKREEGTTSTSIITKIETKEEFNKFENKLELKTDFTGAKMSYKAYGNGVEIEINNRDLLRIEYSLVNAEIGVYVEEGKVFVGAIGSAAKAEVAYLTPFFETGYYFAVTAEVTLLSAGATLQLDNGVLKASIGVGEGGVGVGIGLTTK